MDSIKAYLLSPNFFISIIIIAVCILSWMLVKKCAKRFLKRDSIYGKKETNLRYTVNLFKYIIFIFGIVVVLQLNGINVTSLVTGLGIAGIIVGFALQDILKDLIMGTTIVWDEFFSVGDVIRYGNIEGKVIRFNIKVTTIKDINTGSIFTVSNRNISEIEIISDWFDIDIPSPYEEPAEKMREIIKTICRKIEGVDEVEKCEFLGTNEFADSSIYYRIRLHCPIEKRNPFRRQALGIVQDIYEENNISIPFPQVDVHMKN